MIRHFYGAFWQPIHTGQLSSASVVSLWTAKKRMNKSLYKAAPPLKKGAEGEIEIKKWYIETYGVKK